MKQLFTTFLMLTLVTLTVKAQNNVGIGTTSPHPSAILDLESDSLGLLIPRMSFGDYLSIPDPAEGLLVYDQDLKQFQMFDGFVWRSLVNVPIPYRIIDADQDTYVDVETSADIDRIYFVNKGQVSMVVDSNRSVGINVFAPNPSAQLEIQGTKGLLIPRMYEDDRDAIASPATGLLIYNYDDYAFNYFDGTNWIMIGKIPSLIRDTDGDTRIQAEESTDEDKLRFDVNGNEAMIIDHTGKVGIGTFPLGYPENQLHIAGEPDQSIFIQSETGSAGLELMSDLSFKSSIYAPSGTNDLRIAHQGFGDVMTIRQNGAIGIGTTTPEGSALLELNSDSRGFLFPRMTTTQIEAITAPATGLQIYCTDDGCLHSFDGDDWRMTCGYDYTAGGPNAPETYKWYPSTDFPENRDFSTSFVLDSFGYVGLGYPFSTSVNFYKFDPSTQTWSPIADFPGGPRYGVVSFTLNGYAYVGTGGNDLTYFKDFYRYDPVNDIWDPMAALPAGFQARYGAFAFTIGDSIAYVGGGEQSSSAFTNMWAYKPSSNSWTQKAALPAGRAWPVSFVIGDFGYVGTGRSNEVNYNQFYKYDPAANGWSAIASYPQSLSGGVSFVSNGEGFVGTGSLAIGVYTSIFNKYNPSSDSWSTFENYPLQLAFSTAFAINGKPFVTTGFTPSSTNLTYTLGQESYFQMIDHNGLVSWINLEEVLVESDPQIGTISLNNIPKWDGSALVSSASLYESGGKIGIGTTTPATALHVQGTGDTEISIQSNSPGGRRWTLQSNPTEPSIKSHFQIIDRTAEASRFAIDSLGRIGIGTTLPTHRLTIQSMDTSTLRLIGPLGNYQHGGKLSFGDGNYAFVSEVLDDKLQIQGSQVGIRRKPSTSMNFEVEGNSYFNGMMSIGNTAPPASALLDLTSVDKGLLVPRMSTAQRMAIISPANGLMVFDVTTNTFWYYKSSAWREISSALMSDNDGDTRIEMEQAADEDKVRIKTNGSQRMIINQYGEVGIGLEYPSANLHVSGYAALPDLSEGEPNGLFQVSAGGGGYIAVGKKNTENKDGWLQAGYLSTATPFVIQPLGGNMGIGTMDPKNKLDVEGGLAVGASYAGTQTAPANGAIIEGSVGIGTNTPFAKLNAVVPTGNNPVLDEGASNAIFQIRALSGSGYLGMGKQGASPWASWLQSGISSSSDPLSLQPLGGNLSIGGYSSGSKLGVNGNVSIGAGYYTSAAPSNGVIIEGNVGLGVISPSEKLQVNGSVLLSDNSSFYVGGNTSSAEGVRLHYTTNTHGAYIDYRGPEKIHFRADNATGGSDRMVIDALTGYVGIGQANPANPLQMGSGAKCTASGTWTNASDRRLKKNIMPLSYGLGELLTLHPVAYTMIKDNEQQIGFIAQEVMEILPELVDGVEGDIDKGETLGLNYGNLTAVIVKAVQEQQDIIKTQAEEIETLKSRLSQYENQMENAMELISSLKEMAQSSKAITETASITSPNQQ